MTELMKKIDLFKQELVTERDKIKKKLARAEQQAFDNGCPAALDMLGYEYQKSAELSGAIRACEKILLMMKLTSE